MAVDRRETVRRTRSRLGPVGTWIGELMTAPAAAERAAARRIEELGYGSIFTGEVVGGKDAFAHAAVVLGATSSIVFGTGIANLWSRHPVTMVGAAATVGEAWPGRLVNGIGVSHAHIVDPSGQAYEKPMQRMVGYLDDMEGLGGTAPVPEEPVARVLAALGPRMLELARERADGVHTYLMPPEHTRYAREVLGPDRLLIPEQKVLLCDDPAKARRVGRKVVAALRPNYLRNLRRLGYGDEDLAGGGSDRLVDALVAWGDERAVLRRVAGLLARGADHVLLHPLGGSLDEVLAQLDALAPAVRELVTSDR